MIDWFTIEDPASQRVIHFTADAPVRIVEDYKGTRPKITVETNDGEGVEWTPIAIAHTPQQALAHVSAIVALGAFEGGPYA